MLGEDMVCGKHGYTVREFGFRFEVYGNTEASVPCHPQAGDPLLIEDPIDVFNNVARSCYRANVIQRLFFDAHERLKAVVVRHHQIIIRNTNNSMFNPVSLHDSNTNSSVDYNSSSNKDLSNNLSAKSDINTLKEQIPSSIIITSSEAPVNKETTTISTNNSTTENHSDNNNNGNAGSSQISLTETTTNNTTATNMGFPKIAIMRAKFEKPPMVPATTTAVTSQKNRNITSSSPVYLNYTTLSTTTTTTTTTSFNTPDEEKASDNKKGNAAVLSEESRQRISVARAKFNNKTTNTTTNSNKTDGIVNLTNNCNTTNINTAESVKTPTGNIARNDVHTKEILIPRPASTVPTINTSQTEEPQQQMTNKVDHTSDTNTVNKNATNSRYTASPSPPNTTATMSILYEIFGYKNNRFRNSSATINNSPTTTNTNEENYTK